MTDRLQTRARRVSTAFLLLAFAVASGAAAHPVAFGQRELNQALAARAVATPYIVVPTRH